MPPWIKVIYHLSCIVYIFSFRNTIIIDARRAVEAELDQRDKRAGIMRNYMEDAGGHENDEDRENRNRFTRRDGDDTQEPEEVEVNLDTFDCSLQEWLAQDMTRREIGKRFKGFLSTFVREGRAVHAEKIRDMCARNSASLEVYSITI